MNQNQAKITTPLCAKCLLNNDEICEKCAKLYENHLINKIDVRVMRGINEVLSKLKNINVIVYKIISCGETFLIICDEKSKPKIIGNKGQNARKIAYKIKHNVSIVAFPTIHSNESFLAFFKQIFGEQVIKVDILPQKINIKINEELPSKYLVKKEYLIKEVERAFKLAKINKELIFSIVNNSTTT